jgi:hypothetical protein
MIRNTADQEIWNASSRAISSYPLLDEIQETYNLGKAEAHAGIWAYLNQIIAIDGEENVILSTRPSRPELLVSNRQDVDLHLWVTVAGDAIATVREAFAANTEGE